ncbi:uncharacterized protein LOC111575805 [Amphiprion ocellaris]|uniref:uncharacterized protein LOC111575805 n=1 Tax=Amphiprion ocellaris TaxID=80972 RepID=UPI0024119A4A|nr:uncharacterized protein LOC111575805 [Amphiprion ocellaris]
MEFAEGTCGIYSPIKMLFDTPMYEQTVQTCWHTASCQSQIGLMVELLRLQQKQQLPSQVTAEDMTELLVEKNKHTLRFMLWEDDVEHFDEADIRPLLRLVFEVNTRMKMRDVELEAQRLLNSPEAMPPQMRHCKILSQAKKYARNLTEKQQEAPNSKLLGLHEVVLEVVPKVLQGFYLPPQNTSFNMSSQELSKLAVGVTKAVEDRVSAALSTIRCQVTLSRSIRDHIVQSIQEKVRRSYPEDVLEERLNCFASNVLNTITNVAKEEICGLVQIQIHTIEFITMDSGSPEADSAEVSIPPPPVIPADESPVITAVQDELIITEQPVQEDKSFNTTTEAPKTERKGFSSFLHWLLKNVFCFVMPEDD